MVVRRYCESGLDLVGSHARSEDTSDRIGLMEMQFSADSGMKQTRRSEE
jgi:hypothetical protein